MLVHIVNLRGLQFGDIRFIQTLRLAMRLMMMRRLMTRKRLRHVTMEEKKKKRICMCSSLTGMAII